MKIGELSRATGTNVETIRYYERIAILPQSARTGGNYRNYREEDVERLRFIRHARGLGFDLPTLRSLLGLADEPNRNCSEVDQIASGHLLAVKSKIIQLEKLQAELDHMIAQCRGGRVSDCKIMQALGDHSHCSPGHEAEFPMASTG